MSTAPQHPPVLDPVMHAMQACMGVWLVACLRAALECNLADEVASGPKPIAEIAKKAGLNENALYRCVRALATAGFFTEVSPGVFANTPSSDVLRADHPAKMHGMMVWITNSFHFRTFAEFMFSVRTGETCVEKAVGMHVFDYFPTDPESNREFNNAMTAMSEAVVPAVLETYDFSGMGTICDVASGHGAMLAAVLNKHKDLDGILFDLDHVLEGARDRIVKMGLQSRCELIAGNFFHTVPEADSYMMKHIIHDWEESKALTILRGCVKAMRGDGKVLLIESVLPGLNAPSMGKWIDIEMLAMPGGRERTEDEYRELLAKAGLKMTRVVPNSSPLWVIEAVKA